jgi:hypothetical protein
VELDEEGGGVVAQAAVEVEDRVGELADGFSSVQTGPRRVAQKRFEALLAEVLTPRAVRVDHAVGDAEEPVT